MLVAALFLSGEAGRSGGCQVPVNGDLFTSIILCSQDGLLSILHGEFRGGAQVSEMGCHIAGECQVL